MPLGRSGNEEKGNTVLIIIQQDPSLCTSDKDPGERFRFARLVSATIDLCRSVEKAGKAAPRTEQEMCDRLKLEKHQQIREAAITDPDVAALSFELHVAERVVIQIDADSNCHDIVKAAIWALHEFGHDHHLRRIAPSGRTTIIQDNHILRPASATA